MSITALICVTLPFLLPLSGLTHFNTLGISNRDITPVVTSDVIPTALDKKETEFIQIVEIPILEKIKFHPHLKNIHITSGAGMRKHPVTGQMLFHTGIDLRADHEPVYAVMDGIVEAVGADAAQAYG